MHIPSAKCTTSLALIALMVNSVRANIDFTRIPPQVVDPGSLMPVRWVIDNANVTTPNTQPFNLVLRALSGQVYNIANGLDQSILLYNAIIPAQATGGYHSFYAEYTGAIKTSSTSTNQFNISGAVVQIPKTTTTITTTTTLVASNTHTPTTGTPASATQTNQESSGLSGGALGGIIGGVVVVLLLVALIFFFRHRRLVRERSQHTRLDDSKESYSETTMARSGPPSGGPPGRKEDAMMPGIMSGPGSRPSRDEYNNNNPRSMHPMQQMNGDKNPFEGPEEGTVSPKMMIGGATSLSPREQHQPYQPPQQNQFSPRPYQQQQQQQPYGMPGMPGMPRQQSPFQSSRDSLESEAESAYDPNRMMNRSNSMNKGGPAPVQRNNSNAMMRGGPSPMLNEARMSPKNPFQDRELMAAAAGAAIVQHQSPMLRAASPRVREIEMQPLDIQQHQYEQLQRLQQQKQLQQQQQQQQQAPATSVPTLAPIPVSHPFNPTLYDDKAEVDEDGAPVYNGYRDTIFGHYQPQGNEDDEDEEEDVPMPIVPPSALATMANSDANATEGNVGGATGVQRKKSVKFTVPNSDPIVIDVAAASAQQENLQIQTQSAALAKAQAQAQHQAHAPSHLNQPYMSHSESDDDEEEEEEEEDGEFEEEEEEYEEDEDDIKLRLMEAEVPSPSSSSSRPPFIDTTPGASPMAYHQNQHQNTLSPVRTPDQAYSSPTSQFQRQPTHQSNGGYVAPPPPPPSGPLSATSLQDTPSLGDGFYEDVLAAVDKNAKTLPSVTGQNITPPPQPQHLQAIHMEREVYGAPSPRMKPAAASNLQQSIYTSPPQQPVNAKPVLSPRSAARPTAAQRQQQQQQQSHQGYSDDDDEFYETSLL
ncbi:hypothetical protein BGX26_010604 [Mortierella sp. AD094]|nr:hypothetical protein BGX26_010604 [Mortierella sp. AD094]